MEAIPSSEMSEYSTVNTVQKHKRRLEADQQPLQKPTGMSYNFAGVWGLTCLPKFVT